MMKKLNSPSITIILVFSFVSMLFLKDVLGCTLIERTSDKCRSSRYIRIAGRTIWRSGKQTIVNFRSYQRQAIWYCGRSRERVAWRRRANQIRVQFRYGTIKWAIYSCSRSQIDQCVYGRGASLNVRVDKLTLKSRPTDNVFLGWEWLFGTPADEIRVNLKSGLCRVSSKTREIKKGQTIYYGRSLSINSYYYDGVTFWLTEEDSGFEGRNDLSQRITIPSRQMTDMRRAFDEKLSADIKLDYGVTVKGKNIFQENKWFGFLAGNLCINVLDFAAGPWTGFGRRLARTAAASKFKKLAPMRSGDIAKLYKTVGKYHKQGRLTKKNFFKAVMTYQFRAGVKAAAKKPAQRNMKKAVKDWALSKTTLDDQVNKAVKEAIETGIYSVSGHEGLKVYNEVQTQLDKFSGFIEKLTDSVEFCLSEVLPPSRDALYHIYMTVTR